VSRQACTRDGGCELLTTIGMAAGTWPTSDRLHLEAGSLSVVVQVASHRLEDASTLILVIECAARLLQFHRYLHGARTRRPLACVARGNAPRRRGSLLHGPALLAGHEGSFNAFMPDSRRELPRARAVPDPSTRWRSSSWGAARWATAASTSHTQCGRLRVGEGAGWQRRQRSRSGIRSRCLSLSFCQTARLSRAV